MFPWIAVLMERENENFVLHHFIHWTSICPLSITANPIYAGSRVGGEAGWGLSQLTSGTTSCQFIHGMYHIKYVTVKCKLAPPYKINNNTSYKTRLLVVFFSLQNILYLFWLHNELDSALMWATSPTFFTVYVSAFFFFFFSLFVEMKARGLARLLNIDEA